MNKSTPLSHLPTQPTLPPQHEIISADDDATIQEVLNQITGSSQSPQVSQPQIAQPQQPYIFQGMDIPQPTISPQMLNSLLQQKPELQPSTTSMLMNILTEDFKLATIILVAFVIVNFAPITKTLEKYFSLEKIPYSEIIIKGVILSIVVIFAKKTLIK